MHHNIYTYIIIFLYVTITHLLELHTSRIFVTCEMYYSLLLLCKMPMEATFLCMSYRPIKNLNLNLNLNGKVSK